jgi:acetyl-CoA carboxylase alpha subunit
MEGNVRKEVGGESQELVGDREGIDPFTVFLGLSRVKSTLCWLIFAKREQDRSKRVQNIQRWPARPTSK